MNGNKKHMTFSSLQLFIIYVYHILFKYVRKGRRAETLPRDI